MHMESMMPERLVRPHDILLLYDSQLWFFILLGVDCLELVRVGLHGSSRDSFYCSCRQIGDGGSSRECGGIVEVVVVEVVMVRRLSANRDQRCRKPVAFVCSRT